MRRVRAGGFEITALVDAHGSFGTYDELFDIPGDRDRREWKASFPELSEGDRWVVPFGAYLVTGGSFTALIDTGVGPPPGEPDFLPDRQGWLPERLSALGISRDDIDLVFLTHHHSDHIGWNVRRSEPFFPKARYVTGREAWTWTLTNRTEEFILGQLLPLEDAGVVDLIDDGTTIASGLQAVSTPGHYPGHLSVRIGRGRDRATLLGDVAVHPMQISVPEISYAFDTDASRATATREEFIATLHDGELALCNHYPGGGLGRIVHGDEPRWEPL